MNHHFMFASVFQSLQAVMNLNCFAPLIVTKHMLPMLKEGTCQMPHAETQHKVSGIVVNISAKVASLADNGEIELLSLFSYDKK